MHNTCSRCGRRIGADDPSGLCPACLLARAVQSDTEEYVQQCSRCHTAVPHEARFCAQCGTPVAAPVAGEADPVRAALQAKLAGQYRVVRLLGRGGMGAVYLARDLTLDRDVAIKVMSTTTDSHAMYDRFRREARTAAKLSHPNIVPLHAFGEVEGAPYFVMGYVRGESLAERLRREGKLSQDEARRVLSEVAAALDHAHQQGVIHRDVKPDNILLEDESGRALLTDFGIAKASGGGETLTQHGSVIGTPHYMSPEQASGQPSIDARSDIYSLGVVGYAVLTGRLPFEGKSAADLMAKHVTQPAPPLRSLNPGVSDATAQAIERCLSKNPVERWPDARSLSVALGGVETDQLPDALQSVDGWGVIGLAAAIGWLLFVAFHVVGGQGAPPGVFFINVVQIVVVYGLILFHLHREGASMRDVHLVLWREPSWWLWWYPRRLRRRGNVWDRLPSSVRQQRWFVPGLILIFILILTVGGFPDVIRSPRIFTAKAIVLFGWLFSYDIFTMRSRRRLKDSGLSKADLSRVMNSVPPSRLSFWNRPHIAAFLAEEAGESGRSPSTPHDLFHEIRKHADSLSGRSRSLAPHVIGAARQLLASIDDDEKRVADLTRAMQAGEEDRLRDKIEALRTNSASDESVAPMLALLEKQLELVRNLSERIEEAKGRRARRAEMLRMLALHVISLHDRAASVAAEEASSLSEEVRALCAAVEREESMSGSALPSRETGAATLHRP